MPKLDKICANIGMRIFVIHVVWDGWGAYWYFAVGIRVDDWKGALLLFFSFLLVSRQ